MSFLFIYIIKAGKLLTVEVISLYVYEMIIILYPVHWLISELFRTVCFFIWFIVARIIMTFLHKWMLCMFVKWFLSYIQFIDWFFICLDLYVVSFHLKYYSSYVIGCFTRSNYFEWLFFDFYPISSSLIWFFTGFKLFVVSFHLNYRS